MIYPHCFACKRRWCECFKRISSPRISN